MSLTPSPSNAAEIAGMTLPVVQQNYGLDLDYSPESLKKLDTIVDDLRRDQRFEAVQTLLFSMGCYVGEVLVRHAGGRWRTAEELGMGRAAISPIAVEMPDGRGCNPVARVYRRFQKGREDSLTAFYQAAAAAAGPGPDRSCGRRSVSSRTVGTRSVCCIFPQSRQSVLGRPNPPHSLSLDHDADRLRPVAQLDHDGFVASQRVKSSAEASWAKPPMSEPTKAKPESPSPRSVGTDCRSDVQSAVLSPGLTAA